MLELPVIDSFKGEYEIFSNFYPCQVEYNDIIFPTVEHAYQAAKSVDISFHYKLAGLTANYAGYAKKLGRKVELRPEWEILKIAIMRNLITQKFSSGIFKKALLDSKGSELIEGNHWHDNFWGNCTCVKCKNIVGKNILGKLLMELRRGYERNMVCFGSPFLS